ncbi:MAG: restriction endonuclease subunit S, partial [Eggerthellaceae bacterium]|nr:restriction endonuclease subunit S [Eggerthellaceae bacterium]
IYIIKLNTKKVDPYYLQAYFSSKEGQEFLYNSAQGTRIKVLSKKCLRALPVVLPPMAEQKEIATKFKQRLGEIKTCREKLAELRQDFML